MAHRLNRRAFLKTGLAAGVGLGLVKLTRAEETESKVPSPTADAMVLLWLPGGIAQTDTWDPKCYTPFRPGMKGSELLGTCPSVPTAVDGIRFGQGLEELAAVMDRGTLLRTLVGGATLGATHQRAQYALLTGCLLPQGAGAPSLGSVVASALGPRVPHVPAYLYIGRDAEAGDEEGRFPLQTIGPGTGLRGCAPVMIADPLQRAPAILLDSPARRACEGLRQEKPQTVAAYQPQGDRPPDPGVRFAYGLLLARRLLEAGARFIQVEYPYRAFGGFDMHEDGAARMVEMKRQIDRPLAAFICDLEERGLLDRTLVVIATEFGRTIAAQPAAGSGPEGFPESRPGERWVIANERMYGFHGHFSACNCMLFFGGGCRQGYVHGRTADRHPMGPIEKPVSLADVHATVYRALGIPAAQGEPIEELLG